MKFEIAHVLQANVYVPLAIIISDKLEWERKMESKVFMFDMKALKCWSLLIYVGLKVASKVVKEKKWEQCIHGWYECSNIY